ncbi:MAG: hypothetical protein MJE66_25690 [Proteobacteria bacterium]|nr:hypothetical protein [Pseudomonadota bacterium]
MRASADPALPAFARDAGFNAGGSLPRAAYDSLVPPAWRAEKLAPDARSARVLATGGRPFFAAVQAAPEWRDGGPDPVDRLTRRVADAVARVWTDAGTPSRALFSFEQHGGEFADFIALAEAAGLAAPSRLGLALHPEFGPWVAFRVVVLTEAPQFGPAADPPASLCADCAAPCVAACPGGAVGDGPFDVAACASTRRHTSGCAERCAARHACVWGPEHAYTAEAERHHMAASARFLFR